jgi:hypothetical protein
MHRDIRDLDRQTDQILQNGRPRFFHVPSITNLHGRTP